MEIENDGEDDNFSWALTKLLSRGVTLDEQGRAQETQKSVSHQTPIQEALGISWRRAQRKLIFINHQSFPSQRGFTTLYSKINNPKTNLDHPNTMMARIKAS